MTHVFTYGSLMFERVWSRVVAGTYRNAAASLVGFTRQRVIGQDYPALQHIGDAGRIAGANGVAGVDGISGADGADAPDGLNESDRTLEGVVYFDVRPEDLAALDVFEGADYRRIQVPVTVRGDAPGDPAAGSVVTADTYLYIAGDGLEPGAWDPQRFEREQIERFLREYPPPRPTWRPT